LRALDRNIFVGPHYLQDTLIQMDFIGAGSMPIILLAGFFIGAVMVLQTGSQFTRFGQSSLTGDVVAIALVRELGPAFTGLLVTGRCATGIASELGSMLVTEQVDAMRAMGTDPNRKLVVPRVLASAAHASFADGNHGLHRTAGRLRRFRFVPAAKRDRVLEARH